MFLHRNISSGSLPHYQKKKRKVSILEPYHQIIKDYLDQDNFQATWIYDRIKGMGCSGGCDSAKVYVRGIKEQQSRLANARFETMPGLQAQVDWGDFQLRKPNRETTTIYVFAMVLGFSRATYVEFVDRCSLEQFLDCHINVFHYLKGIPVEILYDNMKNVVIGRKDAAPLLLS